MKHVVFVFLVFLTMGCQGQGLESGVKITVPQGFQVTTLATNLGRARHLAVHPNGDIYLKLERLVKGKGILRLRDKNKDGVVDDTLAFGNYIGTGIAIKGNWLYASSNTSVFRYALTPNGELVNAEQPQCIVKDLRDERQHASKSIALDNAGNLYVNIGAPSNVCQEKDRQKGSVGRTPCPILENAGGIWQFKADQENQSYAQGKRYVTGVRNCVGLDWNTSENALYITVHGRDGLYQDFPELYDRKQGAELPSETLYRVKEGDDCGWPYVHWDHFQNKYILNPEYGGDGKKTGAPNAVKPLVGFPGHMAPNALLVYTGKQFPAPYQNGAFVAFHGSWNRAPENQEGFYVAFVPLKKGLPSGPWQVFANGFSGMETVTNLGSAKYRPCGLAMGPDGSLYVSDDNKGAVWKISFKP